MENLIQSLTYNYRMQNPSEKTTLQTPQKSEDHTTIQLTTNSPEHQPSEVPSDIHANKDDNPTQQ